MHGPVRAGAILAALLAAFALGFWARGCDAKDDCFDSGGAWNDEWGMCERIEYRAAPDVPAGGPPE